MTLNAEYLMELVTPRVDKLFDDRARLEKRRPIDGARFLESSDDGGRVIDDIMWQLFNLNGKKFREQYLDRIDTLPEIAADDKDSARQVEDIWTVFENRVDRASLYLHALWPDRFVFYRKMDVEEAIFECLAALSTGYPELDLEFAAVPTCGRQEYEKLNASLQEFSRRFWPDEPKRYLKLMLLLYWVLPEVMRPATDLRRYWVGMAKHEDDIKEVLDLTPGAETEWSATYQVEKGDYYLVYCTRPVKGIAAIFRATERSRCDPAGGWKGHWVEIEKIAGGIISLDAMKADPLLCTWGSVRKQFQGTILDQVPPAIFNRIRELYIEQGMAPSQLEEAELDKFYESGAFADEHEFEEHRIKPLLKKLGFGESLYQHRVDFCIGSTKRAYWVDFLVRDDKRREVSLFEDKKAIKGYGRGADAYNQARSYALQLGLRSFVVAAPDRLKFYGRERGARQFSPPENPLFETTWADLEDAGRQRQFKDMLVRYAPKDS